MKLKFVIVAFLSITIFSINSNWQQTWLFQKIQVHKGDVIIFVQNYKPTFKLSARDQTFLRCFDTVFRRPYTRYYSITLKVISSLFNRYEIFTTDWSWIKVCPNVVLNKIDVTMKTINTDTRNFEVWCLANKLHEK